MSEPLTDEQRTTAIKACLTEFSRHKGRRLAEVYEVWSERAAIREYLGGLRYRRNAELHAVADTFEDFNAREVARR